MKKLLCMILAAVMILSSVSAVVFADDEIKVLVDGNQLEFDVAPVIEDGRTLVPMRAIFEALGADVDWNESSKTITAKTDSKTLMITIGENRLGVIEKVAVSQETKVDEDNTGYTEALIRSIPLDVPAKIVDGRTLVPIRAVSEGLDADVAWNAEEKIVSITKKSPEYEKFPDVEVADEFKDIVVKDATELELNQISYNDYKVLVHVCSNILRFDFEQNILPDEIFKSDVSPALDSKNEILLSDIYALWDHYAVLNMSYIFQESACRYIIGSEKELTAEERSDAFYDSAVKLLQSLKLDGKSIIKDCTYESVGNGKNMLLIEFSDYSHGSDCKYIGIVQTDDKKIGYYTAEADPNDKENLYFCYVDEKTWGIYGAIGFEKSDFMAAVKKILEKGEEVKAYQVTERQQ